MFALYMGALAGLVLRPYAEGVIFITIIAVSGVIYGNFNVMISGYSFPMVWLVMSAFLVGTAFVTTGLGRRIAFTLIGLFGSTSLRLGYVAAFTDFFLAPATPSNTARTGGITFPIFQNVSVALGSEPGPTARKIGAYLTMTVYFATWATSICFMTGVATNPLSLSVAQSVLKLPEILWIDWAIASLVPGMVVLLLIPLFVYKFFPPEITHIDNKALAAQGLAELGPMTKREKTLLVLFVSAVLGWAIGGFFKIDANAIAVAFVAANLIFKVVTWDDILQSKSAWATFVWYGGIIGIINGLIKLKFFDWMGKFVAAHVHLTGYNDYLILFVLALISLACKYFFASGVVYIASIMPIIYSLGQAAGVPTMPLFWLMAWVSVYGSVVTHYSGAVSPVIFGSGYVEQGTFWKLSLACAFMFMAVSFFVGLPWWKLLGLW